MKIAKNVIVCGTEQLIECSMVLSFLNQGAYVPIINIEQAPVTAEQHNRQYAELKKHCDDMATVSNPILRTVSEIFNDSGKQKPLPDKFNYYFEKLTAFRSWSKCNQEYAKLLKSLEIENVYVLYPFTEYDLTTTINEFVFGDPETRTLVDSLFKPEITVTYLLRDSHREISLMNASTHERRYACYEDLYNIGSELFNLATDEKIHFDPSSSLDTTAKLYQACLLKKPLYPTKAAELLNSKELVVEQPDQGAKQAVLLELKQNATDAVAAQYAACEHAKFIITNPINASPLYDLIEEFEKSKSIVNAHPRMMPLEDIRASMIKNEQMAFEKLVHDAAKLVNPSLEEAIHQLPLTAFSSGFPYSLYKSKNVDWSKKPIGHLFIAESLIILREKLNAQQNRCFRLGAIFDPALFNNTEALDVFENLDRAGIHPAIFKEENASLDAMVRISRSKYLEFMQFITHGSESSVVLDRNITSSRIVQWVYLSNNPIIFNNSCHSWTGIGKECIRNGARAYIGTLWSVSNEAAIAFAKHLLMESLFSSKSLAEAISTTPEASPSQLGYILIGTCQTRIGKNEDASESSFKEFCLEGASYFADELVNLYSEYSPTTDTNEIKKYTAIATLFYDNYVQLFESIKDLHESELLSMLTLRGKELTAMTSKTELVPFPASDVDRKIAEYQVLSELVEDPNDRKTHVDKLHYFQQRLHLKRGNLMEAANSTKGAIDGVAAIRYLTAVESLKNLGQYEEAIAMALAGKDYYLEQADYRSYLSAIGVLGQLYKRTEQFEQALEFARFGFAECEKYNAKDRLPIFKTDEANVHLLKRCYEDAIVCAKEALDIAQSQRNQTIQNIALGILGECEQEVGRFDSAREFFRQGLNYAVALDDKLEIIRFKSNMVTIEFLAKNYELVTQYLFECVDLSVAAGYSESLLQLLANLFVASRHHQPMLIPIAPTIKCLSVLCENIPDSVKFKIFGMVVNTLKSAFDKEFSSKTGTLTGNLLKIYESSSEIWNRYQDDIPFHFRFSFEVVLVFLMVSSGQYGMAEKRIESFDEATRNIFELKTYFEKFIIAQEGQA